MPRIGVKSSRLLTWLRSGTPAVPGTPLLLQPAVRAHKHLCLPVATGKEGSHIVVMFQRRKL